MTDKEFDDAARKENLADFLLRKAGFRIKHRPRYGEPIWERDGKEYTETEAWWLMNREKK